MRVEATSVLILLCVLRDLSVCLSSESAGQLAPLGLCEFAESGLITDRD